MTQTLYPIDGEDTNLGASADGDRFNDIHAKGSIFDVDGNEIPVTDLQHTSATPTAITVGGIPAGTTIDGMTFHQFVDLLLYPELFPTLTAPSSTFTLTQSGLREIGETVSLNFNAAFNRGSISPAYETSGYRSGLPNQYNYSGSGLTTKASTSLTDSNIVADYVVLLGAQNWTSTVSYDEGEQPLSSKGNNYESPLAAGTTSTKTVTITGVYPVFATTSSITVMTKQALASMSSSYFQINMVAESGGNKQTADFPQAWSTITGIQFYNTISSAWEWIGGTKASSLLTFDTESVIDTVQGLSVDYTRYTHNGATIGARQLRFYTT